MSDGVGELSLEDEAGDGANVGPGLQPVKNKKPSKAQKRRVNIFPDRFENQEY